jgi:hypothetical protein
VKLKDWAIVGLVVLAVAQGAAAAWHAAQLRRERIAAANARAAADTSRRRIVGDLQLVQRLAYQRTVELAAAVRERGKVGQANVRLRLEGDSLRAVLTPGRVTTPDTGTVVVAGQLDARDTLGVRVDAVVSVTGVRPGPDLRGFFVWRLERAPATLDVSISCRGADAVADVVGPPWLPLTITEAAQRADVCNPPAGWSAWSLNAPSLPVAAGLVVIGILLGRGF